MKLYRQNNKLFSISNKNDSYKNRYKRIYKILGLKFVAKNKTKIQFYNALKKARIEKEYNEKIAELKQIETNTQRDNLLDVFVVTYNHEKTIERCLDSILEQKTNYPYRIIILDDCSNDNTYDICLNYLKENPDKIKIIPQIANTNGKHISAAFQNIKSKYFCFIDGDDYWCNENKIEKSVAYLEKNNDIVMYVHDVGIKTEKEIISFTHDVNHVEIIKNPFDINDVVDSHLSGRVYRNVIDFKKEFFNVRKRDGILNEIFLSKGKAFFEDEIMSVYDQTTGGVWTSLSINQRNYSRLYRCYNSNKVLGFKYDDVFIENYKLKSIKILELFLGKKFAWNVYIFKKRLQYEIREIKRIHNKFNYIKRGHKDFDKNEMKIVNKISKEWR